MKRGDQMPAGPAKGVLLPNGQRQVVIKMDADQFEEVRALAAAEGTSVAEQIRNLIEWGLEATIA
jgi:hypothetical protein